MVYERHCLMMAFKICKLYSDGVQVCKPALVNFWGDWATKRFTKSS